MPVLIMYYCLVQCIGLVSIIYLILVIIYVCIHVYVYVYTLLCSTSLLTRQYILVRVVARELHVALNCTTFSAVLYVLYMVRTYVYTYVPILCNDGVSDFLQSSEEIGGP